MDSELVSRAQSPAEFLKLLFERAKAKNPRLSLRAWAKYLGFSNHVHLSLILSSQRQLNSKVFSRIKSKLSLSESETQRLTLLMLRSRAETLEEQALLDQSLNQLQPQLPSQTMTTDLLRVLRRWSMLALLELFRLRDFRSDPKWMSRRLNGDLSPEQVTETLQALARLGVVRQRGQKWSLIHSDVFRSTRPDQINPHLRVLQKQFFELGIESLEEVSVDQRELSTFSFAIDQTRVQEAKEYLRRFRKEFAAHFEATEGDELYQLNIQFFPLTNKKGTIHDQ